MKRLLGYAAVALWVALGCALQLTLIGWAPAPDLASGGTVVARALAPDFGTLVLVAAVGRLARQDALRLAFAATLGRAAFTASPPLGVLAGCITVAMVADGLRSVAELDRPALRVVASAAGSALLMLWLAFVDFVRFDDAGARGGLAFGAVDYSVAVSAALTTAMTTAAIAFAFWPIFVGLPGLSWLERRAF